MTQSIGADIGSPALRNGSENALLSAGTATVHVAPAPAPDAKISATAFIVPTISLQTVPTSQLSTSSGKFQPTTINQSAPAPTSNTTTSALPVIPTTTLQTVQTTQSSMASQTSQPTTTSQNALADVAAVFGAKFEQVASTLVPIPVAGADVPGPTITSPASVLDIFPAPARMFKTLEGSDFHMVASMLEVKYATVSTEPLDD